MKDSHTRIFAQIMEVDPPSISKLSAQINSRISRAQARRYRIRGYAHGTVALVALMALIPIFQYASAQAVQSGFIEYTSLLLTDGAYLISSWRELALSIAETIPIMSVVFTLGALLISVNSLRKSLLIINHTNNHRTLSWTYKN